MKTVNGCKNVSTMNPEEILNRSIFRNVFLINTAFSVGITILKQRIILKDDIEFVTEFLCLLGQPVRSVEG